MNSAQAGIRPVLVMNSVTWGPEYDPAHPLYDVGDWFREVFEKAGVPVLVKQAQDLPPQTLGHFSALVLSGSPAAAYDNDGWIRGLKELVRKAVRDSVPTLGICFGSQLIASALGGEVQLNPKGWELGNSKVYLTPEGSLDPLFEGFPDTFEVIESHQDAITAIPPGAVLLATNDHSPIQAYGVGEKLRAVQFHPEMSPAHLYFILPPRRERILRKTGIDVLEVLPGLRSTPVALRIFHNFVDHFVVKKNWASGIHSLKNS